MTVFTVHRGPRGAIRLVADGFSWRGLLFGPLFLAATGAWLGALLYALLAIVVVRAGAPVLLLGLDLAVGLFGPDWRRLELRLEGWSPDGIVVGTGRDHALLRLGERAA